MLIVYECIFHQHHASSALAVLQVLDDNVKRGSRVFESNHVRAPPKRVLLLHTQPLLLCRGCCKPAENLCTRDDSPSGIAPLSVGLQSLMPAPMAAAGAHPGLVRQPA